mmetsp:Transcript_536/g.809  ORF Transcript_536/g.809 Transcript_536/m.809 type:complete len:223 (+) Transcript_536:54-722(+)
MLQHPVLAQQLKKESTKTNESTCRVRFLEVEKERKGKKDDSSAFDSRKLSKSDYNLEEICTYALFKNGGKEVRELKWRESSLLTQQGNDFWSKKRRQAYINTMTDAYHCCLKGKKIPSSVEGDIEFYATTNYSKRGLETFELDQVRKERRKRRNKHCQCILNAQQNCLHNQLNFNEMSRILRLLSEKLSRPEKKYANILAAVDERVVLEDIKVDRISRRNST